MKPSYLAIVSDTTHCYRARRPVAIISATGQHLKSTGQMIHTDLFPSRTLLFDKDDGGGGGGGSDDDPPKSKESRLDPDVLLAKHGSQERVIQKLIAKVDQLESDNYSLREDRRTLRDKVPPENAVVLTDGVAAEAIRNADDPDAYIENLVEASKKGQELQRKLSLQEAADKLHIPKDVLLDRLPEDASVNVSTTDDGQASATITVGGEDLAYEEWLANEPEYVQQAVRAGREREANSQQGQGGTGATGTGPTFPAQQSSQNTGGKKNRLQEFREQKSKQRDQQLSRNPLRQSDES